jgi:septum site-determining protein MinD
MARIIVITSGKGGVGKTTSAINLGAAINHFGKDALVIDGNLTTPNVGIHLGSPEVPVTLNQILSDKSEIFEAIYEHDSGLRIIPASLSIKELKKTKPEKLKNFKKAFSELADYIIVDSAAGLGNEALSAIELADDLIIVTNPEMPAITDALKTIKLAEDMKKPVIGTIVTRVKKNDYEMQPDIVKEMLEIPILGMIPEDSALQQSLNKKDAVVHTHPKSKPARAYKEIAAKLTNTKYDSNKDKERLMDKLRRKFKLK